MEKAKTEKISNKLSARQQQTRIAAFTVIMSIIVVNILWWAGIHFISTDSTDNITINNTSAPSKHYAIAPTK
ncbi:MULTISPECIES: hypothetical protein [Bacteroides]|uniref:Uncharacterized protein n=2 Tax=Bacteroidaceae TaxID=815 RepID=A0ABT7VE23_9BACE|nr:MULTISPECIES: hypothetical protein [Bacteroides]MBU3856656.1 hypothetical protein [Candidatus Phocaeicola excrementipullorum]MBW9201013.1 hypothetical protein [Bacteroidales bacterium SW299]MCR8917020.1 hypothetical protein [Bacteroides sp. ET225]MDM8206972.1 hypothetical protein [Bacteroides gallinaceum]MDM8324547.1 hypothetical protein [Bacteroides gallinaceum]